MDAAQVLAYLEKLCDELRAAVSPGTGFALFVEVGPGWSYLSNCDRKDVVKGFSEWLDLTAKGIVKSPGRTETSHQVDDRLALERKCVEVADKVRLRKHRCVLFLFRSVGDHEISAFVANVDNPRDRVATWVKLQQNLS